MSIRLPSRRAAAAALLAAGTLAACASTTEPAAERLPGPSTSTTVERTGAGIVQRVTITPARPATGDTVTFRSVLVNRGPAPAEVEHVVCGLDFAENRVLADPFIRCLAYSVTTRLAVGDSVVQYDQRVVAAAPGTYTLRATHLLKPTSWALEVPLTVGRR